MAEDDDDYGKMSVELSYKERHFLIKVLEYFYTELPTKRHYDRCRELAWKFGQAKVIG